MGAIGGILVVGAVLPEDWRIQLVELFLVGLLSFLPGWLYLDFVLHRGRAVYDEYVLNLFRLHIDEYRNLPAPPQHTSYYQSWRKEHDKLGTTTTDNLYRYKFESVYGPSSVSTRLLFADDADDWREWLRSFGPVILATIVLCLGWTLTLQPELIRVGTDGPPLVVTGRPVFPTRPLQFGYLGSYVFILQDVVRRYFRDDLKPAAYVSSAMRIIIVALVIIAVHSIWTSLADSRAALANQAQMENVFAFLLGFFPQTGIRSLRAAARPIEQQIPQIGPENPLHEVDGLSIWYEVRLLEEGIEDMENLTTASLVDAMLLTRVPVKRLVDWLDQAFLYLRLPGNPKERRRRRDQLRRLGIRTATNLEAVERHCSTDRSFQQQLGEALQLDPTAAVAMVRCIIATLEGESNYWHVKQYRAHEWLLRDGDFSRDE